MMCAGIQTGKNQNKVQATCSCALNAILTLLFGNIFMTHIAFIHPFSFNWLNAISILIFGNIFMIHVSYIHPSTHQRQECGACPCSHLLRHPHHQCGKTQGGISQRSKENSWNIKVQPDLKSNWNTDLRFWSSIARSLTHSQEISASPSSSPSALSFQRQLQIVMEMMLPAIINPLWSRY